MAGVYGESTVENKTVRKVSTHALKYAITSVIFNTSITVAKSIFSVTVTSREMEKCTWNRIKMKRKKFRTVGTKNKTELKIDTKEMCLTNR